MDETKVWITGWISIATMIIVMAIMGKSCNDSDNAMKRVAIEHNCQVHESLIICLPVK